MRIGTCWQNLLRVEMAPTIVNFSVLYACKYLTPVALMQNSPLNSAVLVLAWPEVTARSDEGIMKFLKSIGLVKNLNSRVGHAAMIIAKDDSLDYYDFGRYISPRRMGRIRSGETDPGLLLKTIPLWSPLGVLENADEVCRELESKSDLTHGEGLLQMSIFYAANAELVEAKAKQMQYSGLIGYHGLDPEQTNCARFVQTAILAGVGHEPRYYKRFKRPITYLAPTPFFNVLAAAGADFGYIEWRKGQGVAKKDPLHRAVWDITAKILASTSRSKTAEVKDDSVVGNLMAPVQRPASVPDHAHYLGGIGEGAWYTLGPAAPQILGSDRYFRNGGLDYQAQYRSEETLVRQIQDAEARLVHDSHYAWLTIEQTNGMRHRAYRTKE